MKSASQNTESRMMDALAAIHNEKAGHRSLPTFREHEAAEVEQWNSSLLLTHTHRSSPW
jgi:hypothetical protein